MRYNVCDDLGKNCELPDQNTSTIPDFQMTGSIVQRIEPLQKLIESLHSLFAMNSERL
jgi:hypothetical protein